MYSNDSAPESTEPIAVVGMGFRFPGRAHDSDSFWRLIRHGENATGEVPEGRWSLDFFHDENPDAPGRMYVRRGGFLDHPIDEFDASFFSISPGEAEALDPQQRLLLETTWEAIEDAGFKLGKESRRRTGVYVAGFGLDQKLLQFSALNRDAISSYTAVGCTMSMLANRLSHAFDFGGPSVAVDTACSGSLVALHLACQSLRHGETDTVVTGGVNVMLQPELTIAMCKGGFLAPDGESKAFDDRADGYGRGEGAGVLVLKRLSRAVHDRDRIHALILSTATNQDGRTELGITVPNLQAQEQLLVDVYRRAGVDPGSVRFVEAHGTGTPTGDPIECASLDKVLSQGRGRGEPCYLGSVKASIGHLEAAAGVAGVIKGILCLKHGEIPPIAGFREASARIPFDKHCLAVPPAALEWPETEQPPVMGVNSFGYGGSNAHVVLQGYQVQGDESPSTEEASEYLVPITANDPRALSELAGSYRALLESTPVTVRDFAYTTARRRNHLDYRRAIPCSSIDELRGRLADLEAADTSAPVSPSPRLAFVYSGNGPQWWGMGRELLKTDDMFARVLQRIDAIFEPLAGWSLIAEFESDEESSRVHRAEVGQPANFALQIALTAMLANRGVRPSAVVGHSVGEVAAGYVSGQLSLEDAVTVSFHRGLLQSRCAGEGGMLAAGLGEEEAARFLEELDLHREVSIAAINGPALVALSGALPALEVVEEALTPRDISCKRLRVDIAYHSVQMDPLQSEILERLRGVSPSEPLVELYSTVTAERVPGGEWSAEYWWDNVRKPVRFFDTIDRMVSDGFTAFLEIGPHPVVSSAIRSCAAQSGKSDIAVVGTLHRKVPEERSVLDGMAELFAHGVELHWESIAPDGRLVDLPSYPWQRKHYWAESRRSLEDKRRVADAPLLGTPDAVPGAVWRQRICSSAPAFLADHRVREMLVFPAAGYLEMAAAAARRVRGREAAVLVENIDFVQLLTYQPDDRVDLQTRYLPSAGSFRIYARPQAAGDWVLHSRGQIWPSDADSPAPMLLEPSADGTTESTIDGTGFYAVLEGSGNAPGPRFRGVVGFESGGDSFRARLELPEGSEAQGFEVHPVLLDSAFQAALCHELSASRQPKSTFVPAYIESVTVRGRLGDRAVCHGIVRDRSRRELVCDIDIIDESSDAAVVIRGLTCSTMESVELTGPRAHLIHRQGWSELEVESEDTDREIVIVGQPGSEFANRFATVLSELSPGSTARVVDIDALVASRSKLDDGATLVVEVTEYEVPSPQSIPDSTLAGVMRVCRLGRWAADSDEGRRSNLWFVTRDCQRVVCVDGARRLESSAVWGAVRVLSTEHEQLRCGLIDLPSDPHAEDIRPLVRLVLGGQAGEFAVRDATCYGHAIHSSGSRSHDLDAFPLTDTGRETASLEASASGTMDGLSFLVSDRIPPREHEVEIRVHSAALGFKDVLKATGVLSRTSTRNTFFGDQLGMECSGTVVRVGDEVRDLAVGDAVLAACPGAIRTYATLEETMVVKKPEAIPFENGGIMISFLTAYYALVEVAKLEKDETLLVHSAAGGLGLSALQVAQHIGANVVTTASTEEKRELLLSRGAVAAFDSRSLDSANAILSLTGGRGVDVVLSSTSAEMTNRTLGIMAPFGRFVELGKSAIDDHESINMRLFAKNLSFTSVDFDRLICRKPELARSLALDVMEGFDRGTYRAIDCRAFPATDAVSAFRYMSKGSHIGRVAITLDGQTPVARRASIDGPLFESEGAFVVTGGLGGLGLELARWLVEAGVRDLCLLGRTERQSEDIAQRLDELRNLGARVEFLVADVANLESLRAALETIEQRGASIRGVFHAAGVLHDEIIANLERDQVEKVLAPKVTGAWNLHTLLSDSELQCFVLFSSVSAWLGPRGQASYAAANAFLDALAHHRHVRGQPALSINIGPMAEVGMVARNSALPRYFEAMGLRLIEPTDFLSGLESLLTSRAVHGTLLDVDGEGWQRTRGPLIDASELGAGAGQACEATTDHRRVLRSLEEGERLDYLADCVRGITARTMGVSPSRITREVQLDEAGLDSLSAKALEVELTREFGSTVSQTSSIQRSTIDEIAQGLLESLNGAS